MKRSIWQGEEDEARQQARPSVPGTIMVNHMTFYATRDAAVKLALANGGKVDGFIVKPAVGRPGKWVIEVIDPEDGFHLGFL